MAWDAWVGRGGVRPGAADLRGLCPEEVRDFLRLAWEGAWESLAASRCRALPQPDVPLTVVYLGRGEVPKFRPVALARELPLELWLNQRVALREQKAATQEQADEWEVRQARSQRVRFPQAWLREEALPQEQSRPAPACSGKRA